MENIKIYTTNEMDAALALIMLRYPNGRSGELNELRNETIWPLTPVASTNGVNNQNGIVQPEVSRPSVAVNPRPRPAVPQRNNINRRKRAMMAACHDLIHEYLALKAKNGLKRS